MTPIQIRPTVKFVRAGAILLAFFAVVAWGCLIAVPDTPKWLPPAVTALLLWPLAKWIPIRFNVTTVTEDRIHVETGILAKTTRTLMLSRVQDVGVRQSLGQRMVGVGDIWLENAGESGRVVLANIDAPQRIADQILDGAQRANNSLRTPNPGGPATSSAESSESR
jgi:uncharacterized membrane protein YdbT with pleckstrin-like domain